MVDDRCFNDEISGIFTPSQKKAHNSDKRPDILISLNANIDGSQQSQLYRQIHDTLCIFMDRCSVLVYHMVM